MTPTHTQGDRTGAGATPQPGAVPPCAPRHIRVLVTGYDRPQTIPAATAEALGIRNGDTIGQRLWQLVVADMAGRRAA